MLRRLTDTPIRHKLMNAILLSCVVVVFLMSAAYMILEYYTFKDSLKSQLSTLADVVASNSAGAVAFDVPRDANDILHALKAEDHIVAAAIYDQNGNLFARYPADIPVKALPASPGDKGFYFRNDHLEGFQPILQGKAELGTLYLKSDMEAMYAQLRRYGVIALLLFVLSLLVAYILSEILQRSISKPILALEQTAKIISEKRDYSVRATAYGKDEIGALTIAFNHMLTRIESQNREIISFNQRLEEKITQRTHALQEANETLKQQKDFVETIINSSIDIIGVFDTEMNYVMLNKRGNEFYNTGEQDIIGRNLLEVYPQLKDSEMVRDMQIAFTGQTITNTSYRSIVLGRYFENSYIPLKDQYGAVYGVLTIAHDITNIMESHEKLAVVNEELLKSNNDLEQFAYIASHDLQEPLRKIQVFTQLLGENLDHKENMLKYQDKINQSAGRMQGLIQDVLSFSRISKKEDAFIDTDLNKLMDNLRNDFELLIQETGAQIGYEGLPTIEGIVLQLSQLFSNLISNSLKYTDKRPVITITARMLSKNEVTANPRLTNKNGYTQISFSDNGIGFDPEYNEQIFTIFQRLHGRQAYSGTGIGLAICRKIAETHQGFITAEGRPGAGAVFTLILPLMQS
ncbi:MAG: ATP-binding protein [Ferruginibacter sp.]